MTWDDVEQGEQIDAMCEELDTLRDRLAASEEARTEGRKMWLKWQRRSEDLAQRLAAVEKERDAMKRELDAAVNHVEFGLLPQREQLRMERDAVVARVKAAVALICAEEFALEELAESHKVMVPSASLAYASAARSIKGALAGLTKEGT